ncbi:MAG TPA: F0F1 ATP synthase subunit alpha [Dyella sp.]|uniref:F0F1 ATP synthase subunit alpha n=1 Tax=Dyella sp. TaxID=1869338 RepID=UPI002B7FDC86|nr:F0F1 ATP synthase subunit alpha [Dyella sp.]HUB90359.1 F0F1 ATP synthase subunit alpha [Dyella sp.]
MADAQLALDRREHWLADYRFGMRMHECGTLVSVGDGVAWITGLPSAGLEDIVVLEGGAEALIYHLAPERIGVILLDADARLHAGARATLSGRQLQIGISDDWLGRVLDPLGRPLDGGDAPRADSLRTIDGMSPPLMRRAFVQRPLYTGNKIVDTLIPIGRGQRQLIIGDNGTGKSALALDTVLRQQGEGVRCVYVLIGQKRSDVAATVAVLREHGALAYCTVIVANANALPGMKYLAPFAGCTVAETWMEAGHDTLVIYDDLSTHAKAYRELSLLLRRPPGREAYPGDIFYLHARLLERATALSAQEGGGSMTALPLVETEQGEIADYIPTNLISITDGQIFLDQRLFAQGQLPAIDVARSVSRIGGKAQHANIRDQAGRIKLDYLQFLELEVFTRFGAKLEAGVEERIRRGRALRQALRQARFQPWPAAAQMAWLVAYNEGLLEHIAPSAMDAAMQGLREHCLQETVNVGDPPEAWRERVHRWLEQGHGPVA